MEPSDFNVVRNGLQASGYSFAAAELTYLPQNMVTLQEEKDIKNMEKLIDMLEDNDDVQEVYHNWELPADI
jgi:transcriptional/translational regulatory protein YebC/TACO1